MNFIYENKIVVSIICGILIGLILYYKNINTEKKISTVDEGSEDDDKNINDGNTEVSSILKGLGFSLAIYLILYFMEDNNEEVYNYIDTGEPAF